MRNRYLILILVAISLVIYIIQIAFFRDARMTFFYFLQDLAFFLLEITMIYFILRKLLEDKERREKMKKLDVVISAYFSESGTLILNTLSTFDNNFDNTRDMLNIDNSWSDDKFKNIINTLKRQTYSVDSRVGNLYELKDTLVDQKNNMLLMLQNPSLLEHDYFTDMLWAVFHLLDELISRKKLVDLPQPDFDHLSKDIERAYKALLIEWVYYCKHLKHTYPYLFSLAERKKPFYYSSVVIDEK